MFDPPSSYIATTNTSSYYNMDTTPSTSSSSKPPVIPRLTDLCKRVLKANVAHIVDVGDVPFEMVKDILFGCRVEQLREIEELSPHIAEEDEEIWEYFFKRDFPIVAEARAKAISGSMAEAGASKTAGASIKASQTSKSPTKLTSSKHTNQPTHQPDFETEEHDDDLFSSYRDLYYDEQVRREEKLASAGERLKERMLNLAAMKSSRQTILDPRLSLNLRKKRRGQITLPTGRRGAAVVPWGSGRPKTLTEKARAKASQLAFAYEPPRPRFTRSASMQVGFIPPRARPVYKEDSLEEVNSAQNGQSAKAIFGPRRDRTASGTSSLLNLRNGETNSLSHSSKTSFVQRVVSRPAKSSMERPHKVLQLPERGHTSKTITRSPSPIKTIQDDVPNSPSISSDTTPAFTFKNIPGITRRPLPPKMIEKQALEAKMAQATETALSAASPPPVYSPPPMSATSSASRTTTASSSSADLPMLSQPARRLPPGPSLFIPRKKPKIK